MKAVRLSVLVVLLLAAVTGAASAKSVVMSMYSSADASGYPYSTGFQVTYLGESVDPEAPITVYCNFVYYDTTDECVYLGCVEDAYTYQYETHCYPIGTITVYSEYTTGNYPDHNDIAAAEGVAYFYTDTADDGSTVTADFLQVRALYFKSTPTTCWGAYPINIVSEDSSQGIQTVIGEYLDYASTTYDFCFAAFPLTLFDSDTINDFEDEGTDGDGTALDEWASISGQILISGWDTDTTCGNLPVAWTGNPYTLSLSSGQFYYTTWVGSLRAYCGFVKSTFEPGENCPPAAFYGLYFESNKYDNGSSLVISPFKPE